MRQEILFLRAKSLESFPGWPVSSWFPMLIALACLVMLIWLIFHLTASVTDDTDPAESDRQMLLTVHELHREGDLTAEEFRSLKGQLMQRITGSSAALISADSASVSELPQVDAVDAVLPEENEKGKLN